MNTVAQFAFGRPIPEQAHMVPQVAARPTTALIGRVFLATIFLISGVTKFVDLESSISSAAAVGLPWPEGLIPLGAVVEVLGGLSILFGVVARIGALALAAFTVIATFYFHDFWNFGGLERQAQMIHFLKNLAILGGMLLLMAEGAGRYSLDHLIRKRMA
jgi:putative oxidoreductase